MPSLSLVRLLALATFLLVAVVLDVRHRRIPNRVTVTGALVGLALGAVVQGGVPTAGLVGALTALVVTFPLFALGGIGAGDAKLLAMAGTYLGPGGLLGVLLYGGLVGGLMAVASAVRGGVILPLLVDSKNLVVYALTFGRHGERRTLDSPGARTIPYGVAIAAGAIAAWFLPLSLVGAP